MDKGSITQLDREIKTSPEKGERWQRGKAPIRSSRNSADSALRGAGAFCKPGFLSFSPALPKGRSASAAGLAAGFGSGRRRSSSARGQARLIWDQEDAGSSPACSTKGQSRGWRSGWAKAPPGTAQGMRQVDNLRVSHRSRDRRDGWVETPPADESSGMRQYGTAPWWGPGVKSAIASGESPVRFRPVPPKAKAGIGAPAGRKLPLGLHRDCADWYTSFLYDGERPVAHGKTAAVG